MADVNLKLDLIKFGDQTYHPPPHLKPLPAFEDWILEESKDTKKSIRGRNFSVYQSNIDEEDNDDYIPCLYLPAEHGGTKLVIYFHGNAEDIGLSFDLLTSFGDSMQAHMLAVEYPGYGLYKGHQTNELQMQEDCEAVYDYLTTVCGVDEQNIILWGRSLGSGPCSYLASLKRCHSIILMSPFASIKAAAKDILGWASFMSFIVEDKFRNIDYIKVVNCPVFIMHGLEDSLIPF